MMRIVRLKDCVSNQIVYNGNAEKSFITERAFQLTFGRTEHQFCWKIDSDKLVIESISEVKVILPLEENKQTNGRVETEFGTIDLTCFTSLYRIDTHCIEVKYELIQEDEKQEFHFILEMETREEPHEIH